MTTTERNKIDLRISTTLLELSILHVELTNHGRIVAAELAGSAGDRLEQAKQNVDHLNYLMDNKEKREGI